MCFESSICLICLRTDRKLKFLDKKLTGFYNDLIKHNVNSSNHQYCWECEYHLKKSYNFKIKCKEANKILQKWKENNDTARPFKNMLYKLLPQSLNLWTTSNNNVHNFSYCPNTTNMSTKEKEIFNTTHVNVHNYIQIECITPNALQSDVINHAQFKTELDSADSVPNSNESFVNEKTKLNVIKEEALEATIEYVDIVNCIENPLHEDDNCNDDKINQSIKLDASDDNENDTISVNQNQNVNCVTDLNDSCVEFDDGYSDGKGNTKNIDNESRTSENDNTSDVEIMKCNAKSNRKTECDEIVSYLKGTDEDCPELNSYMQKAEYIVSKLKIVSHDVEAIFDYFDRILPKKKRKLLKEKSLRFAKDGVNSNKICVGKLKKISESMTKVIENTEAALKKMPIDRKRCKADLIQKFEACGELKTKDGCIIDKQFVVSCLDDKVPEYYWKLLWKNTSQGTHIPPSAKEIQLYSIIQNKYKETKFNTIFEIEYLNTDDKMLEEFNRRKSYDSYVNADYKCDICHQWFRLKSKMVKHMGQHNINAGNVACLICKLYFKDRLSRTRHHETHKVVYKCKACPMITHHRSSMVKHYSDHTGARKACELCHKLYKDVNTHRIKVHKREHSCTTCGHSYFTEDKLKSHVRNKHSKQPEVGVASVRCDQCEMAFISENARQKHVKMSHTTPQWILTANGGRYHAEKKIRTSYERKQITCEVCGTSGRNYWWMVNHAKKDHPDLDLNTCFAHVRKHLCHVCGAGFSNKYYLRGHMKSHGDVAAAEAIPYKARGPHSTNFLEHRGS